MHLPSFIFQVRAPVIAMTEEEAAVWKKTAVCSHNTKGGLAAAP
jgi:hypothetical protein